MGLDLRLWLGGHCTVFGGSLLAAQGWSQSLVLNMQALIEEGDALSAKKTAGYERRADDWTL